MGRLPILHVWFIPYYISIDCFLVEMGETIQTPWISSSMGMPLQLSYRDDFCLKFKICECNTDSLGEGTALCMNREVVGQTSFFNGSQRKLDSWAFLRTPDAVMYLSTYWANQCHMVFFVPCSTEEWGKHAQLIHWPKDDINLQLEQNSLGVRFPCVLWSSRDHFGLTWGKGLLLKMVSVLTSGSCMSNIVL